MITAGGHRGAFSLIELVIVVVVIGTIAGIAVPRLSRGAATAAQTSLRADLSLIRGAIERYRAEHDNNPPTSAATISAQLTMYSNSAGATSATKTSEYRFGPYLRQIPEIRVGPQTGKDNIRDLGVPGTGTEAWFYNKVTGDFCTNTTISLVDADGVPYKDY